MSKTATDRRYDFNSRKQPFNHLNPVIVMGMRALKRLAGWKLAFCSALAFCFISPAPAAEEKNDEGRIETLMPEQIGHHVGGVTLDRIGNIYVADFAETVWKITPEGEASVFATGFYGASGNAINYSGKLLQSNFYNDTVSIVSRDGEISEFISDHLKGPVGIVINKKNSNIYVANCFANSISCFTSDGVHLGDIESEHFKCPNGVAFDNEQSLYVVNFRNNEMIKVPLGGAPELFAKITEAGLGHVTFVQDRFYVTAFQSHQIYEVSLNGESKLIAGAGARGVENGPALKARLSYPNGITSRLDGSRLYFNEFLNDGVFTLPRKTMVRQIIMPKPQN